MTADSWTLPKQRVDSDQHETDGAYALRGVLALYLLVLSVLTLGFVLIASRSTSWLTSGLLLTTIAAIFLAWASVSGRRTRWKSMLAVALIQLLWFAVQLIRTPPPYPARALQAGIVLLWGAAIVTALLGLLPPLRKIALLLAPLGLALIVWTAELAAPVLQPALSDYPLRLNWVKPHAQLGYHHPPNGEALSVYPSNPRNYFEVQQPAEAWTLHWNQGSTARLEYFRDAKSLRVRDIVATDTVPWYVGVSLAGYRIRQGARYVMHFRARAAAARRIRHAVTQAHEPWQDLGLYRSADLATVWKDYAVPFTAKASDGNARLLFDLAEDTAEVEIANVSLSSRGREVKLARTDPRYVVKYRFNGLGCRGRDYAIPRQPGTTRILVLGDSYALGEGVHEPQTFPARLEALLTKNGVGRYEVVNCAVSGFDATRQCQYYEQIAGAYQPDIVLLVVTSNEAAAFSDDNQSDSRPRLFVSTGVLAGLRKDQTTPDYTRSMDELRKLYDRVRASGAILVVAAFRDVASDKQPWPTLLETLRATTESAGIPLLDLGDALLARPRTGSRTVHGVDNNPNETVHAAVAEEMLRFLTSQQLLPAANPEAAKPDSSDARSADR